MNIIEHDLMLKRWNSRFLISINPNSQQISWRKGKEDEELTLFIKDTQEHLLKLAKFSYDGWKKLKSDEERWWSMDRRTKMKKETNGNSLESFKTIYIYQVIFGEQLPLCPSHYHDLPNKSFNYQFNQFNPCSHDISITKYFSWKFKFTLDTKLPFYPSKPSNSIVVQSFENLRMLHIV